MNESLILKNLNLLFVDDQSTTAADAYAHLSPIFKQVGLAHNFDAALTYFKNNNVDILITDIELQGELDGLKLIKAIRTFDQYIPIIILSSKTKEEYLLEAINQGIDGYLIKPLDLNKFNNTLDKIAERLQDRFSKITINDNLSYDFNQKKLHVDQEPIKLGPKERTLLELLLVNKNKSVTKTQIRQRIWQDHPMTESALKSLFAELRKKLKYNIIINIPSIGWMIQTHDESETDNS